LGRLSPAVLDGIGAGLQSIGSIPGGAHPGWDRRIDHDLALILIVTQAACAAKPDESDAPLVPTAAT